MMYRPSPFGWIIYTKYSIGVVIINEKVQIKWKEMQRCRGKEIIPCGENSVTHALFLSIES